MAVEAVVNEPEQAPAKPERLREIVVDLLTPAQAHGDIYKQLKFRRPTGGDIMKLGELPIHFDRNGNVTINPGIMGQMMAILASVPPSTIERLDSEDWSTCAYRLVIFFVPGM